MVDRALKIVYSRRLPQYAQAPVLVANRWEDVAISYEHRLNPATPH
jgi:hypothetical protein